MAEKTEQPRQGLPHPVHSARWGGGGGGGGGDDGTGTDGSRTCATYFAEEGGLFCKTSACPRFCKRMVLFGTQVLSMGGQNPRTIHEIYAGLTASDSRSD